jgi:DNA repair protein RadC
MRMRELQVRYLPRTEVVYDGRKTIREAQDAARFFFELFANELVEVFGALFLDTKHRLICYHEASRGCLDSAIVHPRELFRAAFLANAAAIIVGHNHPSGDPDPSEPDRHLTARLVRSGDLLGVPVLDHIIVGDSASARFYSFRQEHQI